MQILFVSRQMPIENGSGAERRAAQHLAGLKKLGRVTLIVPPLASKDAIEQNFDPDDLNVENIIIRTEPTQFDESFHKWLNARNPFKKIYYKLLIKNINDQRALAWEIKKYRPQLNNKFDIIFCFRIASAIWLDSILEEDQMRAISILDFDDIESVAHSRLSAIEKKKSFAGRSQSWFFGRWLRSVERRLARKWDFVMVCSDHDREVLFKRTGVVPIAIPNSVSIPPLSDQSQSEVLNILFVGTMSYAPNVIGITWFANEVWARIYDKLGMNVTLTIAGANPKREVVELAKRPGISVLGRVADLSPFYEQAQFIIVPIFSGGGTRIKLIEAMAHTRAVITTSIGCEGLELSSGEAEIANDADAFVEAVIRLASNANLRKQLAESGYRYVNKRFSNDIVTDHFVSAIAEFRAGVSRSRQYLSGDDSIRKL